MSSDAKLPPNHNMNILCPNCNSYVAPPMVMIKMTLQPMQPQLLKVNIMVLIMVHRYCLINRSL